MRNLFGIFCSVFIICAELFAGADFTGLPPIRTFSPEQYQSAAENWDCVQNKRGILYFANENRVLEYDGGRWNAISVADGKSVRSLALDSSGRVYVGAVNDFGYLDIDAAGATQFVSLRSLLPDTTMIFQEVWKTHVLPGEAIFHADNLIIRYRKNSVSIIPVTSAQDYSFVLNNRLFVYQRNIGLSQIAGDTVVVLPGGSFYRNKRIRAMLRYGENTFLVGTENGIYLYDGKKSRRFVTEADRIFAVARIFSGESLGGGLYVFGTMGAGVVFLDAKGKLIYHIDKQHGLFSDLAFALCTDREHGVWVAQIGGISRIDFASPVTIADSRSGFDVSLFSLVRHKQRLYFGTADGVYMQRNSPNGNYFTIQPTVLRSQDVPGLFSFEDGILAGCGEGTFFYHNGAVKKISPAYAVSFKRSSRNPSLVYGADYSIRLLYYHNKKWIDKGSIPGIQESIHTCVENEDGSLWLFTYYNGIIHVSSQFHEFDPSKKPIITRYGLKNGLPSLKTNSPVTIRGKLFFSTDQGLYSFDSSGQRFLFDSLIQSLFSPPLPRKYMLMDEEKNGDILIAAQSQRWETEMLYYRRTPEGTYRSFPTAAGLLRKMNATPLLHESSGVSWFASGDRLLRFDRGKAREETVPFETRIGKVKLIVNDSAIYFGNPSTENENSRREIRYSYNALRFEFSGMSYIGDENEFQSLLEGMDQSWSLWTTEQYKEYSLLPPGDYRFRVRSKNAYGEIGREASFAFIVLPPWWGTAWFRLGAGIIGIAIIVFLTQRISARRIVLMKLEEEKRRGFSRQLIESQEKERKRISSELHDSLGQNLLIMKNMIDLGIAQKMTKSELKEQMQELSGIASRSLEETRTIASNLHPYQLNRMGLVKALNAMARNIEQSTKLKVAHQFDSIDVALTKEMESHLYRIVQESVNNALKYSGATLLTMSLKRSPDELRIAVTDNGKGFDIHVVENGAGSLVGGLGLFGLKERARIIGGTLNVRSETGKGTTVEIILPLEEKL